MSRESRALNELFPDLLSLTVEFKQIPQGSKKILRHYSSGKKSSISFLFEWNFRKMGLLMNKTWLFRSKSELRNEMPCEHQPSNKVFILLFIYSFIYLCLYIFYLYLQAATPLEVFRGHLWSGELITHSKLRIIDSKRKREISGGTITPPPLTPIFYFSLKKKH